MKGLMLCGLVAVSLLVASIAEAGGPCCRRGVSRIGSRSLSSCDIERLSFDRHFDRDLADAIRRDRQLDALERAAIRRDLERERLRDIALQQRFRRDLRRRDLDRAFFLNNRRRGGVQVGLINIR